MRTRPAALAVCTTVLLVLTGCGSSGDTAGPGPSSTTTTPSTSPTPTPTPTRTRPSGQTVRLIQAGSGPMTALRLAPRAGTTTTATLTTRFGISIEVDGQAQPTNDVPAILIDITLRVVKVDPDGNASLEFTYGKARLEDGAAPNPTLLKSLRAINGIKGSLTVDDRGSLITSHLTIPDDLPDLVKKTLESLKSQLGNLTVPLPEEPVGLGASWTSDVSSALNGIRATIAYTYTLKAIAGDGYTLGVSYDQRVPAQRTSLPGLPEGTTADTKPSTVHGSGTSVIDLGLLLPKRSDVKAHGTLNLVVEQDGQRSDLKEVLDIELGIS